MNEKRRNNLLGTILVVDDTPENVRLLLGILAEHGYKVRPATDGAFALQSVWTTPPDLILLDVKMPGMDGYEVCRQLKADERSREIPIIFLSALGNVEDKVKGFTVGGVDYITKPFQAEEVLARVSTHLALRHLQQHLQQEVVRRTQAEEELRTLNEQLQQANQQLATTNQQLQEANASKDTFFSIIAHDLRNPFSTLIGLTEAMLEGIDNYRRDRLKHFLERLHSTAENTYALLTNLLTWSRLQRGVFDYMPDFIPIYEIVTRIVSLSATGAEHKQIQINNLVPSGTLAYADLQMTETVIRNLVSNALKFTPVGGTITISSQQTKETIEIAVSDTGIGMTPENLATLFRIDVRSTHQGTAGEEGSGLGLILCKELAAKNGGDIRVESELNRGSRFIIELPCYMTRPESGE